MVKDAPQASTWWSEHHKQLVRFENWQTRILGSIFLGVPIVLPGSYCIQVWVQSVEVLWFLRAC